MAMCWGCVPYFNLGIKQISVLLTEALNVFQFCIQKPEFIIVQLLTKELISK